MSTEQTGQLRPLTCPSQSGCSGCDCSETTRLWLLYICDGLAWELLGSGFNHADGKSYSLPLRTQFSCFGFCLFILLCLLPGHNNLKTTTAVYTPRLIQFWNRNFPACLRLSCTSEIAWCDNQCRGIKPSCVLLFVLNSSGMFYDAITRRQIRNIIIVTEGQEN